MAMLIDPEMDAKTDPKTVALITPEQVRGALLRPPPPPESEDLHMIADRKSVV